ncbi:hypothetical protein MJ579_17435 [Klebsiella pneumoniae]|nr:hypothetical protein MJ579_17435 [Klebsiella pneumoniae]
MLAQKKYGSLLKTFVIPFQIFNRSSDAPTITLREVYATKLIGFKNDAQQLNAGSVVNTPLCLPGKPLSTGVISTCFQASYGPEYSKMGYVRFRGITVDAQYFFRLFISVIKQLSFSYFFLSIAL